MASPLPSVKLLPYGAIIQSIVVNGINIVQGFPKTEDYIQFNKPYFGATIGRVANRIANARINDLNGRSYQLTPNDGTNSLHGGETGWSTRTWATENVKNADRDAVQFTYTSLDGEDGFPGEVQVVARFTPYEEVGPGNKTVTVVQIEYAAELVGDDVEETVINMTNHSYFNLSGGETIEDTDIVLATTDHLPFNQDNIPIGPVESYPVIKAGKAFTLGSILPEHNECFVFPTPAPAEVPIDTRNLPCRVMAMAYHPSSNINLQISSTEPAFQLYTGDYVDVPELRGGEVPKRGSRSGFCVEPCRYVNAINVPEWKKMVLLKKGQKYGSKMLFRAWEGPRAF